jgi:hypothetical protein
VSIARFTTEHTPASVIQLLLSRYQNRKQTSDADLARCYQHTQRFSRRACPINHRILSLLRQNCHLETLPHVSTATLETTKIILFPWTPPRSNHLVAPHTSVHCIWATSVPLAHPILSIMILSSNHRHIQMVDLGVSRSRCR